jgi:ABC-type transport system involved in Fe-S cluster assembly fused permease/ATPase subunit
MLTALAPLPSRRPGPGRPRPGLATHFVVARRPTPPRRAGARVYAAAAATTTTPTTTTPIQPHRSPLRAVWHLLWPPGADDALRALSAADPSLATFVRPPPTPVSDLPRPLPPLPPGPAPGLGPTLRFLAATALADPHLAARTAASVALILVSKAAGLAAPLQLKVAVDAMGGAAAAAGSGSGGGASSTAAALRAIALFSASRLLSAAAREAKGPLFMPVAQAAARSVAAGAFAHVLALDPAFHLRRRAGSLARCLERGVRAVAMVWRAAAFTFLPTAVELVLVCALLASRFTPAAAAGTAGTFALYCLYTVSLTRAAVAVRARMVALDAAARGKAVEALSAVETVRTTGSAGWEAREWDGLRRAEQGAAVETERLSAALNAGQAAILTIGLGCVMAAVVASPGATAGDLVAAQGLLLQAAAPLSFLGWFFKELRTSLVDMADLFALLRTRSALPDGSLSLPPGKDALSIELENVSFSYGGSPPVLDCLSLSIPAGAAVAVVGPSGSGKSTLLRLLTRAYDPDAGTVRLGGVDVRDLRSADIAGAVAVVPQDTALWHDTIARNIAYGGPHPDAVPRAAVETAAAAAALGPALARMPAGLDTLVGAGGARLSGGERQRVSIARACLRDPRVLLADEATSALDSATEAGVMASLASVARSKTAVFVAHRLSSVAGVVDEIVVLVKGRVVERGPHASLVAAGGVYARMWAAQAALGGGGEDGGGSADDEVEAGAAAAVVA